VGVKKGAEERAGTAMAGTRSEKPQVNITPLLQHEVLTKWGKNTY
jgi:hypothetical protein